MTDSAIVVFTARGFDRMLKEGGSQAWVLNEKRARGCKYVVCVQNRDPADNQHNDWGDVSDPHKNAFFIGKISDIVPSPAWDGTRPKKWLIRVSEYAHLAIPDMWDGARNPVAYSSLKALGIKEDKLVFNKMPAVDITPPNVVEASASEPDLSGITIQQAKKLLAKKYEVSEECIEIIIRA
ncbi:hypothetical protein KXR87_21130 [Yokenella regensburgei]|uniref:hypothetical protein n=1 Tax=Yokenella regensburgei TaxID=158877 RepID=UPI003F151F5F